MKNLFKVIFIILFASLDVTAGGLIREVCGDCIYKNISSAIDASSSGDILFVKKGRYSQETINVNKSLSLIAESGVELVHEGAGDTILVTAPNVTIKGFKILGSGKSSFQDFSSIKVSNTHHCTLVENEIVDAQYGIMVANSDDCVIHANNMKTKSVPLDLIGDGIHIWKSMNTKISNNSVHGHRDGIYLEFSKDGTILENNIKGNQRYGLHFMFSDGNEFRDNTFSENDAGVAVMYSKKIRMIQNTFSNNTGAASFGLLLKDISDSEIMENNFIGNTVAAYMEGSNRNHVALNIFDKNGWAIRILSSCDSNVFEGNAFLNNSLEVATNSEQSQNVFIRNYWSHHKNVDLNNDGIADLPYQPTSFSSYILERYNISILLIKSPVLSLLDWAEKMFPALSPISLRDPEPLMSVKRRESI